MRTLNIVILLLAAVLSGCSTLVPAPARPSLTATTTTATAAVVEAEAAWAQVLHRFVNEQGEVDFPALAAAPGDLEVYVRHVADTPLEALPDGPIRLAHMINAYNALSMFNVLRSGIPATHAGFNKVTFFVFRKLEVGDRKSVV